MPPVHAQENSSRRPHADYEQWVTEQYGHKPDPESERWKLSNLYQNLVWKERFATRLITLEPTSPYQSIQLACREQSTILIVVLGHLMALFALVHVMKGKNRQLDVLGA